MKSKRQILKEAGYVPKPGRPKKLTDPVIFSFRLERAIFDRIPHPKGESARRLFDYELS